MVPQLTVPSSLCGDEQQRICELERDQKSLGHLNLLHFNPAPHGKASLGGSEVIWITSSEGWMSPWEVWACSSTLGGGKQSDLSPAPHFCLDVDFVFSPGLQCWTVAVTHSLHSVYRCEKQSRTFVTVVEVWKWKTRSKYGDDISGVKQSKPICPLWSAWTTVVWNWFVLYG